MGARYDFVDAIEERESYWTPHELTQIGVTGELNKRKGGWLVALDAFVGMGKENVRPGSMEAYQRLRQQAIEQDWLDELGAPPESDWQEVFIIGGGELYQQAAAEDGEGAGPAVESLVASWPAE